MEKERVIPISDSLYLDLIKESDKASLITALNDKIIYENTLRIPYPYTLKDAEFWIELVYADLAKYDVQTNWAIRRKNGELIGGIGLMDPMPNISHKNELGYWLAKSARYQGIMGKVLNGFGDFCLNEFGIIRLEANIFSFNEASARVLEKSGFEKEGECKKRYLKDGKYMDSILFAKILK